jgi:hypothetical protein
MEVPPLTVHGPAGAHTLTVRDGALHIRDEQGTTRPMVLTEVLQARLVHGHAVFWGMWVAVCGLGAWREVNAVRAQDAAVSVVLGLPALGFLFAAWRTASFRIRDGNQTYRWTVPRRQWPQVHALLQHIWAAAPGSAVTPVGLWDAVRSALWASVAGGPALDAHLRARMAQPPEDLARVRGAFRRLAWLNVGCSVVMPLLLVGLALWQRPPSSPLELLLLGVVPALVLGVVGLWLQARVGRAWQERSQREGTP